MSEATLAPRVDALLSRLDSWADRGTARALLIRLAVTVAGPLVVLAGVAMLVLPGPGLVVIAAGLAVLALEYPWARHALGLMVRKLSQAREAALPKGGSRGRRALGMLMVAAVAVAGFVATSAITAFLGAHTVL
jgi:uncharacterized protein (TIGR02611 family)